jgi:hypothetical protein
VPGLTHKVGYQVPKVSLRGLMGAQEGATSLAFQSPEGRIGLTPCPSGMLVSSLSEKVPHNSG